MMLRRRLGVVVAVFVALLSLVSGKPAWGNNGNGLANKKPNGKKNIADGSIDFDSLSPKDCASFLCVTSSTLAEDYIESGCPGQFANYEAGNDMDMATTNLMESTASSTG